MTTGIIKVGQHWRYIEVNRQHCGRVYRVVAVADVIKIGGEWQYVHVVSYIHHSGTGRTYARFEDDFLEKFALLIEGDVVEDMEF